MISVFGGTGFIGKNYQKHTTVNHLLMPRNDLIPLSDESLWFISTTNNYHVFDDPLLDIKTNLLRLVDTLKELKPGHTFNFVSSWFVYGKTTQPASEDSYCDPKGFYSITKRAAEQLLISYCDTHKINWRIFRLSNIYGPGDKFSEKKNALTHMIGELKANRPISLYWGGKASRDYLHVKDLVAAIDICLTKAPPNIIINIGSGHSYEFGNLINTAKKILNSTSEITAREPSEFHQQIQVRDFYMNTEKINKLGFEPKISIHLGIKQLCSLA